MASFDGYLELTPNSQFMQTAIEGETTDARRSGNGRAAAIEIGSFTFGSKEAIAVATQSRKEKDEETGEAETEAGGEDFEPVAGERTGKQETDFRFQITKQLDRSSPFLMRAFFSNSFREKRPEFNDFSEARVTLRRRGAKSDAPHTYLTMTFLGVFVAAYEMETQGKAPPEETIEFCFQACEMKYRRQLSSGEKDVPVIGGWDFREKAEFTVSSPSEDEDAAVGAASAPPPPPPPPG